MGWWSSIGGSESQKQWGKSIGNDSSIICAQSWIGNSSWLEAMYRRRAATRPPTSRYSMLDFEHHVPPRTYFSIKLGASCNGCQSRPHYAMRHISFTLRPTLLSALYVQASALTKPQMSCHRISAFFALS